MLPGLAESWRAPAGLEAQKCKKEDDPQKHDFNLGRWIISFPWQGSSESSPAFLSSWTLREGLSLQYVALLHVTTPRVEHPIKSPKNTVPSTHLPASHSSIDFCGFSFKPPGSRPSVKTLIPEGLWPSMANLLVQSDSTWLKSYLCLWYTLMALSWQNEAKF